MGTTSTTLIGKFVGKLIPLDFLSKVVAAHPHAFGMSILRDGQLVCNRVTNNKLKTVDPKQVAEGIDTVQKNFKDSAMIFGFVNNADITDEDVPPYQLLARDGAPSLFMFLDGDFGTYGKPESSKPPEYHYTFGPNGIIEHVSSLYKMVEEITPNEQGRVAAVFKGLDSQSGREKFNVPGKRFYAVLHGLNGQIHTFSSVGALDTLCKEDWGWATKSFGMLGKKEEPEKKSFTDTLMSGFGKLLGKTEEPKPQTPHPDAPPPTTLPASPIQMPYIPLSPAPATPAAPLTAAQTDDLKKIEEGLAPAGHRWYLQLTPRYSGSNNSKKAAYDALLPSLPPEWKKNGLQIEMPETFNYAQVPSKYKECFTLKKVGPQSVSMPAAVPSPSPDVTTHHIPDSKDDNQESSFMKIVLSTRDKDGNSIPDPKTIEAMEGDQKWPSFQKRTGFPIEEVRKLSMDALLSIGKEHPELAITGWRDANLSNMKKDLQIASLLAENNRLKEFERKLEGLGLKVA